MEVISPSSDYCRLNNVIPSKCSGESLVHAKSLESDGCWQTRHRLERQPTERVSLRGVKAFIFSRSK